MKNHYLIILFLASVGFTLTAQNATEFTWWNPANHDFPVIEGQGWPSEVKSPYDRLPHRAEGNVRDDVWGLSRHAAGQLIRFRSNAEEIVVRYTVGGNLAMEHMPATGVSGVDLYAINSDGKWLWCRGSRSFSDTVTYRFSGMTANDAYHDLGREYRLFLPLYNSVQWLEIGVKSDDFFRPLAIRMEKPIVVYGTSIAHGACASRPGMAWTAILGRELDHPLINLAFSGNGRLEKELIDLIEEIDARIYILDCLPNLVNSETYPDDELTRRIIESVRQLRAKRPSTPILLVEHAGYTDGDIMTERKEGYQRVNQLQKEAFAALLAEGIPHLYYLTKEEIGLELDDMVDGTHPNDLGMQHYAEGYERKLRDILSEPIGKISTLVPCTQYREPHNYDWEDRHREILQMNQTAPPKTVILANSIIHFWGGLPRATLVREEESWRKTFTPDGVRNYAYGWDRIENVLWRIYHGELDGFVAERVVLMIGTNNLHLNNDSEIIAGLIQLVGAVQKRQPHADIVLMGLLPRRNYEERIAQLNLEIAQVASASNIKYANIGHIFLDGPTIDEALFSDGLHPNEAGYRKMAPEIGKYLR